jgi:hypothetical protein
MNVTRIATELRLLQGTGTEYLVDNQGAVLLKFVDGKLAPVATDKRCNCLICEATLLLEAG